MVGKFSTSRSPTSSAWSSISIQRNWAGGNLVASARNPGRYSTKVSHHPAHKQETTKTFTPAMLDSMQGLAGMAGLVAIAWLLGEERRRVPWRAVGAGIVLELVLAVVFLKVAMVKSAFLALNDALLVLERATQAGTGLVFGYLGGAAAPFAGTAPEATFILAFRALPLVLVISALSALLFYWGVLPAILRAISLALH